MDTSSGGIELLLEVVEATKSLIDGLLERSVNKLSAVAALLSRRSEVLPEQRVVDVT